MKCNYCGYESESEFKFCPTCGANCQVEVQNNEPEFVSQPQNDEVQPQPEFVPETQYQQPQFQNGGFQPEPDYVSVNLAKAKILPALKDTLFLVICILMTVSCGLSIIGGNIPLIAILLTVFSWLVYSAAKKDIADTKNLRSISGTVYASYIVMNVCAGIFIVCGLLFGAVFSSIADSMDLIMDEIGPMDEATRLVFDLLFSGSGWIIAFVFLFMAGIILLINLLGYRKIHRFAKSVYVSIENHNPNMIEYADATKTWLWVFGIFGAVGALFSITSGVIATLAAGCDAAVAIIAAILIKKYVLTNEYTAQ